MKDADKIKNNKSDTPMVARNKKSKLLESLKLEIAAELGLLSQAKEKGWHSLSARDAGRIGGLMSKQRRKKLPE